MYVCMYIAVVAAPVGLELLHSAPTTKLDPGQPHDVRPWVPQSQDGPEESGKPHPNGTQK